VTLEDLGEVHHGAYAGFTNEQIELRWPGELARRAHNKYLWRFPGGESYADADERAGRALAAVAEHQVRRPLLVSHEMIGLMLGRAQMTAEIFAEALLLKIPSTPAVRNCAAVERVSSSAAEVSGESSCPWRRPWRFHSV